MTLDVRTPTDDDIPAMLHIAGNAFGEFRERDDYDRGRALYDFERFRIAIDDGEPVGVGGSFAFDVTLPGGASVPVGGVTWMAVLPTHRRRGVLRSLLGAVHDDLDARGEPLALLWASEAGIYERFGYGRATRWRDTVIDRDRVRWRPEFEGPGGVAEGVRILRSDTEGLPELLAERWERARLVRPGEISRPRVRYDVFVSRDGAKQSYAVHDDGYAVWKVTPDWDTGVPRNTLELDEFVAATPAAHAALWRTVLSVDLVTAVKAPGLPLDDPLPWMFEDQRAVRTTVLRDGIWANVRDLATCFGARAYAIDDPVVLEVDGERWRIGAEGVRRVRSRPDLVGPRSVLGPLLFGGVRASTLAAAGRIEARDAASLRRADLVVSWPEEPWCDTGF